MSDAAMPLWANDALVEFLDPPPRQGPSVRICHAGTKWTRVVSGVPSLRLSHACFIVALYIYMYI